MSYGEALSALAFEISFNQKFKQFLQTPNCTNALKHKSLEEFLIKPVQRICQYPLILERLQKELNPTFSPELKTAHANCASVQQHFSLLIANMKEAERRSEKYAYMAKVHNRYVSCASITGDLCDNVNMYQTSLGKRGRIHISCREPSRILKSGNCIR